MSYFYAVNRDNPLGYFSIDFNYRYIEFDAAYTPYGGTVNLTPGSSAYSTLPVADPYRLISNYGSISQLKVVDQSYINNIPSVFGVSYSSPIVSGNKYAAQINAISKIDITNLYDAFVPASTNGTWSAEFWASLDWMDGQGMNSGGENAFTKNNYRTDIGFRSTFNAQAKINLLDIGYYDSTGEIWTAYGSVVYNQSNNCIEFYIPKSDGSYAKSFALVKNLDIPMHIYVSYSNKTINVVVNGETGISASVDSLYLNAVVQNDTQSLKFRVSGEIYNPLYPTQSAYLQDGQYFLVSNLAFYNYILNSNQINNHLKWASYDNKPVMSSIKGSTHFFTLEESQENFQYKKSFIGKDFNNYTQLYNLAVTSDGLSPNDLSRISFTNLDGSGVLTAESENDISAISPDPGVNWYGSKSALDYPQAGTLLQVPCTISLILEPLPDTSPAYSSEYIFSISGVNGISTLYVERSSATTYRLVYYDASNGGTATVLASVTSTNTLEYHKLALSLTSSSAQLTCVSSASQTIAAATDPVSTASSSAQTFSFTYNSGLTIGQSYHLGNSTSVLTTNSTQFSYLGIVDSFLTDFTYTDQYINGYHFLSGFTWTQTLKYGSPLQYNGDFYDPTAKNQTFPMYQLGYWIGTLPLTSLDAVVGSKIDWTSTNSCLVEYSFYNSSIPHQEQNWYTLSRRGAFVSGFDFTKELSNMLIRVTILSEYDVAALSQTFNNLQVGFYRNMNFYSDDAAFTLKPNSSSIYNSSYTIKSHAKSIQTRSNNLGVLFPYSSHDGNVPGSAQIVNTNSSSLQGADFWFRPDTNYKGSVVLSSLSSVSNFPHLYINASGTFAWNSNISKVYINGQLITNSATATLPSDFVSAYTITPFNPIHIVVVFANSFAGDLYLNGYSESVTGSTLTFNSATDGSSTPNSPIAGTTTLKTPIVTAASAGQNPSGGLFSVTAGRTYTVTATLGEGYMQSPIARTYSISVSWYDSSSIFLSTSTDTIRSLSSSTSASYAPLAPATAAYGAVSFSFYSIHVGEQYSIVGLKIVDSVSGTLSIHKIGDVTGASTSYCRAYVISSDTTIIYITPSFNPDIYSQSLTTNRFTVIKKAQHSASVILSSSTTYTTNLGTRQGQIGINWIDGSGNLISSTLGGMIALSAAGSQASASSFPPDNAVYGNIYIAISNADFNESYYVSGLSLTSASSGPESSFGFINLWDRISVPEDVTNRYALFTTNTVALLSNDNYMNDPNNRLSFDSAKESLRVHKIGN